MVDLLKAELKSDSTITIRLVNGSLLLIDKSTVVNIEYKNIIVQHRLYLLEGTTQSIILGMDFYEKISNFPYDKELSGIGEEINNRNEREFTKASKDVTMTDIEQMDTGSIVELKCQSTLVPNRADRQLIARVLNETKTDKKLRNLCLLSSRKHNITLPSKIIIDGMTSDSPVDVLYMGELENEDDFKFYIGSENAKETEEIRSLLQSYKHLFAFKSTGCLQVIAYQ